MHTHNESSPSMRGRRIAAIASAAALICSFGAVGAAPAFADTYSSGLVATAEGAVTRGTIPAGALSVVNFAPKWGDKQANKTNMLATMEQAHANGVKMIVFPEMSLTGYVSSSDPESPAYRMAVSQAETTASPITQEIAAKAKEYGMWVVYGTPERIPGDGSHAYNSAFAISPEGKVSSYQKIAPVEGAWATPGTTPVIQQTEWGLMGLSICYDTYANPEIERYYAAQGVGLLVNPTATSRSYTDIDGDGVKDGKGWEWYYRNRLESIASRDGLVIASADLVGPDGYADESGKQPYDFPGGSVILTGSFAGANYAAGLNEDGSIAVGTEGALTNAKDLRLSTPSTTQVANDFHPDYYAKWYGELADRKDAGESLSYSFGSTDGPKVAVANVSGVWADKAANTEMMAKYAEQAHADGVDLLVFPETVLTGYDSTDPKGDADAHSVNAEVNRVLAASDDYMQVLLAEKVKGADGDTTRGESVQRMAQLAKDYGMYIVFGLAEMPDGGPIVDGGVKKVYNSAAICFPDGHTESYQKMHRAGSEETVWSVPGNTPVMFEMPEWTGKDGSALKAGVNICRDGHFYPELGRYYAASGAELLIHPTATGGNPWYRETRIGSYTDRDGMAAVTANLWGQDGYPIDSDGKSIYSVDANGKTVSSGKDVAGYNYSGVGRDSFRSTSLIINAWGRKNGTSFDYATGSALDTSGTGNGATADVTKDWYFGQGGFDPDNLETRTMDLSRAGFRITNFQPRLYSQMYDAIAQRTVPGYSAMYSTGSPLDTSALDEPAAKADAVIASPSAYTAESVEPVQEALLDARSLLGNTTFSAEQQPLVEAAAAELNTALAGLEKAAPTPTDPAEPNQPAAPADPADTPAGTPIDQQLPSGPADGTVDTPATAAGAPAIGTLSSTGSQIALVAALALMGVAGGSVLIVAKRKAHVE